MFLRDRVRGRDTWSLVVLGVVLCALSVLGLTGAFGDLDGAGRFGTVVLIGVPLGLVAIGGGIANGIRGLRDTGAGSGAGAARTTALRASTGAVVRTRPRGSVHSRTAPVVIRTRQPGRCLIR